MPLPPNLITDLRPLLLPYMRSRDEREALLIEAFYLRDPRPLDVINFEGGADVFYVKCVADLIGKIGCLVGEQREHTLAVLLKTVRSRCDALRQADIDRWLPILNDECIAKSQTSAPRPDAPPVTTPPQTPETPVGERLPSVFISYSHADTTFADWLIDGMQSAGHPCWIDTSKITGGADWQKAICDGINASYAMVVVCSEKALESEYVWDEVQWARNKRKLIIPVILENVIDNDNFFGLHRFQGVRFDQLAHPDALKVLLAALPAPSSTPTDKPRRTLTRRECELAYLDRLRFEDFLLDKFELTEYAPMSGVAQIRVRTKSEDWDALNTSLQMNPAFTVLRRMAEREMGEHDSQPESFTDAVSKLTELRRAVVLGEPGAGKTHTLRAIAKPLYTAALTDPTAPIPFLVKLGNWDNSNQPFEAFLRESLGELGAYLDDLLTVNRAVLLLDGLNEMPADQRGAKYPQVEAFIKQHSDVMAVVTCREADYTVDLHMNRVVIRPLDVLQIRDFADRALKDTGKGEAFFWRLAGGEALKEVWHKWEGAGASFELFWNAPDIPRDNPNVHRVTSGQDDTLWRDHVRNTGSLMRLASSPYMLRMLLDVYIQFKGGVPTNRGQLFDQFVNVLLVREKLATLDDETGIVTLKPEGQALVQTLQQVAYEMQVRRAGRDEDGDLSAGTALPLATAQSLMDARQTYLAVSANLLLVGETVRFSHQLLQEYFAARYMDEEIKTGRLKAIDIWKPQNWWERTNWEEAAILLAGLYSDDCTRIVEWVNNANPEVAAQCVVRSGAALVDSTRDRLRAEWLSRLTDLSREPSPLARAAVGRALGLTDWDTRKGVGLGVDDLPEFDWVNIPAGEFIYGDDDKDPYPDFAKPAGRQNLTLPAFKISRYPVTYRQFQAFIDAPDGFHDPRWWEGLKASNDYKSAPGDQYFKFWNYPREQVSWYDAIAFCRWLSYKLGGKWGLDEVDQWPVSLPTEFEWERAARGTDGRIYPYGDEFDAAKGNTRETRIRQTSAVGMFPDGASPDRLLDMSGNVWEWCLTNYGNPAPDAKAENLQNANTRVLRGGSWNDYQDLARAAYRFGSDPDFRFNFFGFRVVLRPPSHGH